MIPASAHLRGLLLTGAAVVSCGGSDPPRSIARNSNFSTFSSVAGTVSTSFSDGTTETSVVEVDNDEGVGAGACEVSLQGDVIGRVGQLDLFIANASRIVVECERDGAQRWYFIGTMDNLTLTRAGDMLAIRDPRSGGPVSECSDTAMPVDVSVFTTDAIGTVDPSAVDVDADFLRRVRVAGTVGQTVCGVTEMNLDIVAEILPDAFNFTESSVSAGE